MVALVCFGWIGSAAMAERVFIDAFAATVNGYVILESDIQFEMKLLQFEAEYASRTTVETSRDTILERLVDRELLLNQARRFVTGVITETEIQKRISDLDTRYGGQSRRMEFLKKQGLDEEFWRLYVRNQLLLDVYISQRIRPFVRVNRDMEDEYIIEKQLELGLTEFDDPVKAVPENHPIRSLIRELIEETLMQERMDNLLQDLRNDAMITYSETVPGQNGLQRNKDNDSKNNP